MREAHDDERPTDGDRRSRDKRGRPVQSTGVTAAELHDAYETQLRQSLDPPWEKGLDPRGTRAMLNASIILPAAELREEDHQGIWIWSDLHLDDATALSAYGRPYQTVADMDAALFAAWRRLVAPDDTVICLGDMSPLDLCGEWLDRVRAAPGRTKILVYGNHDQNGVGGIVTDGFEQAHLALVMPGDPPLVLTHIPLRDVPDGAVNVHGHIHHRRVPGPTPHINVSVEQLGYRPWPLDDIRQLARRIVRHDEPSGETTADEMEQLDDPDRPGTS